MCNRRGKRNGGRSPLPFFEIEKEFTNFVENGMFVCICELNSDLKCSFKIIKKIYLEKKIYFPLSILCRTWNAYLTVPIPRNLTCPKTFLVARWLVHSPDYFHWIWKSALPKFLSKLAIPKFLFIGWYIISSWKILFLFVNILMFLFQSFQIT